MKNLSLVVSVLALLVFVPSAGAAPGGQSPCSSPFWEISSPTAGARLQGTVEIRGSACLAGDFNYYKFEYLPPGGVSGWVWVFNGQQEIVNGLLGLWDTRPGSDTFGDGTYTIRLTVVRRDGNFHETPLRQVLLANQQPVETPTPEGTATPESTSIQETPTPIIIPQPTVVQVQPTPFPEVVVTPGTITPSGDDTGLLTLPDVGSLGIACLSGGVAALLAFGVAGIMIFWRRGSGPS